MKRRITLALAAVLLVVLVATGGAANKKIVFGIGISAPYAPFIAAVDKGFLEKRGAPAE